MAARKPPCPRNEQRPSLLAGMGAGGGREREDLTVRAILPGGSASRRWPPPDKAGGGGPRLTAWCAVPGRGGGALNSRASHWHTFTPSTGSSRITLAIYLTGHPLILQRPCAANVLPPARRRKARSVTPPCRGKPYCRLSRPAGSVLVVVVITDGRQRPARTSLSSRSNALQEKGSGLFLRHPYSCIFTSQSGL